MLLRLQHETHHLNLRELLRAVATTSRALLVTVIVAVVCPRKRVERLLAVEESSGLLKGAAFRLDDEQVAVDKLEQEPTAVDDLDRGH